MTLNNEGLYFVPFNHSPMVAAYLMLSKAAFRRNHEHASAKGDLCTFLVCLTNAFYARIQGLPNEDVQVLTYSLRPSYKIVSQSDCTYNARIFVEVKRKTLQLSIGFRTASGG